MPDNHKYNYNYQGFDSGDGGRSGESDFASWVPIIIFLFCFPPLGVLLLVLKLMGVTGKKKNQLGRHPYDLQRETGRVGQPPQTAQDRHYSRQAQPTVGKGKKHRKGYARVPDRNPGKGMTIGGAIMAAFFGIGAMTNLFAAMSGEWYSPVAFFNAFFVPLAFCGGGLFLTYLGVTRTKKAKRYRKYLNLIGKRESISVVTLAEAMGLSQRRVCNDLQDMLDDGIFPTGYLDMRLGRLVLNSDGVEDNEPEPEPQKEEVPPPKGMEREEAVLSEIREVNNAIADPVMTAKINRIGEITGKIFAYLRDKPDKEGQLRSFLSYYLPTTLKILRAYAQMESQGIEGENINAAKSRIEGMMDKVVDGFEKQLDKLFQDDAMDITTDVEVLERMLDKDGLGGGQGLTLGG